MSELVCFKCLEPITGDDWTYTLFGNGPIHSRHRLTDDQLLAMLDGLDEDDEACNALHYADGIDNADIYRDGRVVDRELPLSGIQDANHPLINAARLAGL